MIIKPKVHGFLCITAHPEGCSANVNQQIDWVRTRPAIAGGPKRALIIGASRGYGLASRIVSAFGCGAGTLGIFYERPPKSGKPASPGWYNDIAFKQAAYKAGLFAESINRDAFSNETKAHAIDCLKKDLGPVDLVIYSLASPRRIDPVTGETYTSCLKPTGKPFTGKTVNTDKKQVHTITLDPATEDEILGTKKVMGGEDWKLWIQALEAADLLAEGTTTVAYSYVGPEVTWPLYRNGTIGKAKEHLEATVKQLHKRLQKRGGRAFVSINKAVVTQASAAIPVVPLYIAILFKVMRAKGIHEDCIEQIYRLYADRLYNNVALQLDTEGRIRIDDWEMRDDVQEAVTTTLNQITTKTLEDLAHFSHYQTAFLNLFGFSLPRIDYTADVAVERYFS